MWSVKRGSFERWLIFASRYGIISDSFYQRGTRLHTERYKILQREVKDLDENVLYLKTQYCQISILLKLIYRFSILPNKIMVGY